MQVFVRFPTLVVMIKNWKRALLRLTILLFIFIASSTAFHHLWDGNILEKLRDVGHEHVALVVIILVIVKSLAIVYPPLPGSIVSLSALPFIGWQWAYLADILGSFIGSSIAYHLGKRFGKQLMHLVMGERITDKLLVIKIKKGRQVQTAYMLRLASAGVISDGFSWAAYDIGYHYTPFQIGYMLSHVTTTLPIFYMLGASLSFASWILIVPVMVIAWLLLYRFKGSFFE